jgi:hypothetical protein
MDLYYNLMVHVLLLAVLKDLLSWMGFVPVEMDFIYQEESVFAVVILDAQLVVLP